MTTAENTLEAELERLLDEDLASVISREQTAFDRALKSPSQKLVLFGAGSLGRKALAGLRKVGIEPLAFADNNPAYWHTKIDGLEVLPLPEAARRFGQDAAFIVTIWKGQATEKMAQRVQRLLDLGCTTVIPFGPLFLKYRDIFLPYYAFDLPHKTYAQAADVKAAFSLCADASSREEFLAQLRWRALTDSDSLPPPVQHETYLPDDLVATTPDEVFIDCGAFDGDTLRAFVARRGTSFRQAIAFEPDPANFRNLEANVGRMAADVRDKISIHPFAVGARAETVFFGATGTEASAIGGGTLAVNCIRLDDFLQGIAPTYMKFDIEGSEPDAILGASDLIATHLPVLAVCAYHCQNHLWKIPLIVNSLSKQYKFFFRPHLSEGWDLVCYAVPGSRLLGGDGTA